MEVVGAIVGSALTEPFRFLFGSIYGRVKNVLKIRSNYKDLEKSMESLMELKQLLDDAELQQRHLPRTQVQDWLRRVEKLQSEFDSMRSTLTTNGNTIGASGCMCSLGCRLSNDIAKGLAEVKQLIGDGRAFENKIVGVNPVPNTVEYIPASPVEGQPTASRNLAKMMDMLMRNEKAKMIGVWGMGGVGKTTLVKNLNNELSKEPTNHNFGIVIWVVVSQNATIEIIQSKIAKRLHLPMDKEASKESSASHLYNKLKGKRFLLILDDIWEGVDLNAVGIPPLEDHIGSKIILTTRNFNVCQQMSTDIEFEIGRLSDVEAWELFSQRVGEEVVNDDQIRPLAKAIVEECDGLPLAIITVGASLRKKTEVALWKGALYAMQKSEPTHIKGVEERVYKHLKWSYDSLEGEQLKSCFLFLCLYPEDFEIDTHRLVQYWQAEGLLDEQQNYEQLLDDVIRIVDCLIDSCLLEKGVGIDKVKMHDVVRDVGVWIAKSSEDWCKSIICSGISEMEISQQVLNCPDKVKRVSFMDCKIAFLPDCNIPCPETTTIFLQGNWSLREVPNKFLQGFQMLRTLDLSKSNIMLLPDSLLQLHELRALILRHCYLLHELPPLEALGKLQILDCSFTSIAKLPSDFEKLTNLKMLLLYRTHQLRKIPTGKFRKLRLLEVLNMEDSGIQWGTRDTIEGDAAFEDLLCLNKLVVVYIDLKGIPCLTTQHTSWFRRIKKFKFHVNRDAYWSSSQFRNEVFLGNLHFSGDEMVGLSLLNAHSFSICECEEVDLMLDSLVKNSASLGPFVNLKVLRIQSCCIFGKPSLGKCVVQMDLLPNLELLSFNAVRGLESLSSINNFLGLCFTKLKEIELYDCYDLENLLVMDGTLQKLERVEKIYINGCEKLTEVFKNVVIDNFVPNLLTLSLWELPALKEICKANISWKSLEQLEVRQCNMLRKLPLGIQIGESIQSIRGDQHWWNELEWDTENLKKRLQSHFEPWAC